MGESVNDASQTIVKKVLQTLQQGGFYKTLH